MKDATPAFSGAASCYVGSAPVLHHHRTIATRRASHHGETTMMLARFDPLDSMSLLKHRLPPYSRGQKSSDHHGAVCALVVQEPIAKVPIRTRDTHMNPLCTARPLKDAQHHRTRNTSRKSELPQSSFIVLVAQESCHFESTNLTRSKHARSTKLVEDQFDAIPIDQHVAPIMT